MNKNFNLTNLAAAGLLLALLSPVSAFAQMAATSTPSAKISSSLAAIIARADKEITQRVTDLNNMITRIAAMKKVSANEQNTLTTSLQNEITQLNTLKTKIDSDTSAPTARTDYQSITKSYRIYLLVLPQTRIVAASDRVLTIVDTMSAVGGKVQSRISATTGTNVAQMNQLFSDFTSKMTDATTQANTANVAVAGLQPDQGNKTVLQANTTALKGAQANIKTATADLTSARTDLGTIVSDLKATPAQ